MVLDPALNTITSPGTNFQYEDTWVGSDGVGNDLDDVEANLLDGQDTPFRIGYAGGGGHFMTMTDVRRDDAGNRTFLVSDPWTGATRWVTEADMTARYHAVTDVTDPDSDVVEAVAFRVEAGSPLVAPA